jgi:hypothetical protein
VCNKKGHNSYQCGKKDRKKNKAEKMKGEKEDKTKQKANKATVLLVALSTTAMDSSEYILG